MKDKQLTLKEVITKIGAGKCISCNQNIAESITYQWRIPLCKKCRIEAKEDLEDGN